MNTIECVCAFFLVEWKHSDGGKAMDKEHALQLGALIKERRLALGITTKELGERIGGVPNSTITRMEQGAFAAPSPEKLAGVARVLGISLADLYAYAGYSVPNDLPGFRAYLPARYRNLPAEAIDELTALFEALVSRHGLELDSEAPTNESEGALEAAS
jgi:transcriptional regulator with XRE-family HTH domain